MVDDESLSSSSDRAEAYGQVPTVMIVIYCFYYLVRFEVSQQIGWSSADSYLQDIGQNTTGHRTPKIRHKTQKILAYGHDNGHRPMEA